jgi:hypothetical protein
MRFRIHASKNAMIIFDIHFSEIIISLSVDTYSIEKLGKNALVSKEIKNESSFINCASRRMRSQT